MPELRGGDGSVLVGVDGVEGVDDFADLIFRENFGHPKGSEDELRQQLLIRPSSDEKLMSQGYVVSYYPGLSCSRHDYAL